MDENIYRRFKLINEEKEEALFSLIKEKHLSYEDLQLILSTLKLNITDCGEWQQKMQRR